MGKSPEDKLAEMALKGTVFVSSAELISEFVKDVDCPNCGKLIGVTEEVLLQKYIVCPKCSATYENNYYDQAAVEARKKSIKLPMNCFYDFSIGIHGCLETDYCTENCGFNSNSRFNFHHGRCENCGAPLDQDKTCLNDCQVN